MGRKAIVTKETAQEINKLYNQGFNMVQIGKRLNLGHSTVCNYVWKPRERGPIVA